jgi:hypothetical protein
VDVKTIAARAEAECKARGLMDAATVKKNANVLVTIIQQALGIEAARIINSYLKEDK